jgi:hypothetical protein
MGALLASLVVFPAAAEELAEHLGPVGPHDTILASFGDKRVIAYYEADRGECGVNLVVWNRADETGDSRVGLRVNLSPRQMVQVDTPDNKSLNLKSLHLQCGNNAATLAVVKADSSSTARITTLPMKKTNRGG